MEFSGHSLPVRGAAESQSEMTELILPNDTNTLGNLLGGRLMHFILPPFPHPCRDRVHGSH
jgi:acyl-CoA hydrolase